MKKIFLMISCFQVAFSAHVDGDVSVIPLLIIGSGPAGLMAGVYGGRAKLPTMIISGPEPGGQLMGAAEVENMPAIKRMPGAVIMDTLREQAESFGAQIVEDTVIALDCSTWPFRVTTEQRGELSALALIIATGSVPRCLGIPGEQQYWSAGVSACSICDCFLFEDKEVAIVGGGDSAIEYAMNLVNYARHVTIFVRKPMMRAAQSVQDRIKNHEKITVIYEKEILEVLGDGEVMTGLRVRDIDSGEETVMPFDGLFLAIGHVPNTELCSSWVSLTPRGYIELKPGSQATSIPGVFAAGDVADPYFKQVGIAAASGIQATLEAVEFLRSQGIDDRAIKQLMRK